jgi:asparagine synthase (glutamine-hydrolysing)
MSRPEVDLVLGANLFRRSHLNEIASAQGAAAAWREEASGHSPVDTANAAKGDFAVFIDDSTSGGNTFAAVDRFGIQTLCYRADGTVLRAAQRAVDLALSPDDIDPQAILDYLYFHVIPSPRTFFRGVSRLPPASIVHLTESRCVVEPYWRPRFEVREASFEAKRARFLNLLAQAVESGLDGTRPACFLSGGTDSSTVAGMIRQVTGRAPATYSIGFEAEGYDEMAYARLAARHFGTEHHEHYITPEDLIQLIPQVAAHQDQPFGNSSLLPAHFCALKARADGVTQLLAGDGGDELFGGNSRYATQRIFSWYDGVPRPLRTALLEPLARGGRLDGVPIAGKTMSYVRQASVPMPKRLQTYNLLHRLGPAEVLSQDLLAQVKLDDPEAKEHSVWNESEGASFLNRMLAFDWRYTLAENDLPKVRMATELAGVRASYPMLDQDLAEFSMTLPDADKLKGLRLRWFFKEALRGFLPDEIIAKKKQGFGLPFGVWMVRHNGLKAMASDSIRSLGERRILKLGFAEKLLDQLLPQHPGYYGSIAWVLTMLEQWLRQHAPKYRCEVRT